MPYVGIFSFEGDLHAHAVRDRLEKKVPGLHCDVIESDEIAGSRCVTWTTGDAGASVSRLVNTRGEESRPEEMDLVWWRRSGRTQKFDPENLESDHVDLINNDCAASLLGSLLTCFAGTWVSDPIATKRAENKLYQLEAARSLGLRIPRTLVSQDPHAVRQFCADLDSKVIVKPVRGTAKRPLFTRELQPEHLRDDETIMMTPAIYQEAIDGDRHLRINCFGSTTSAVMIESDRLDWRENLDIPIQEYQVPADLEKQLQQLLDRLNLRMGIVDCKINSNGEIVWLEVNPQGQFLFLEGITGLPLTDIFTQFLVDELDSRNIPRSGSQAA